MPDAGLTADEVPVLSREGALSVGVCWEQAGAGPVDGVHHGPWKHQAAGIVRQPSLGPRVQQIPPFLDGHPFQLSPTLPLLRRTADMEGRPLWPAALRGRRASNGYGKGALGGPVKSPASTRATMQYELTWGRFPHWTSSRGREELATTLRDRPRHIGDLAPLACGDGAPWETSESNAPIRAHRWWAFIGCHALTCPRPSTPDV